MLLDKVAPANVKFQRYADNFEEYVDVNNNERLDEDEIKLLALVLASVNSPPSPLPPKNNNPGHGSSIV